MGSYSNIFEYASPCTATAIIEFESDMYVADVDKLHKINLLSGSSISYPISFSGTASIVVFDGNLYLCGSSSLDLWKLNDTKDDFDLVASTGVGEPLGLLLVFNNRLCTYKGTTTHTLIRLNVSKDAFETVLALPYGYNFSYLAGYNGRLYASGNDYNLNRNFTYRLSISELSWETVCPVEVGIFQTLLYVHKGRLFESYKDGYTNCLRRLSYDGTTWELIANNVDIVSMVTYCDRLYMSLSNKRIYNLLDTEAGVNEVLSTGNAQYLGINSTNDLYFDGGFYFRKYSLFNLEYNADVTSGLVPLSVNFTPTVATDVDIGVIAFYPFNGNANDEFLRRLDGVLYNGPSLTTDRFDNPNSAYSFDGNDDIIQPSYDVEKALIYDMDINSSFTYSLWAFPTATRASTPEETFSTTSGTSNQRYALFPARTFTSGPEAGVFAGVSVGTNGISVFEHAANYMPSLLVYNTPISDWTHIVIVYERNRPRLYINGTFIKWGLQSNYKVYPTIQFGMQFTYPWPYGCFAGKLDEVAIFSRVLSDEEISSLYYTPYNPPSPIIDYLWEFGDTGSSTDVNPLYVYTNPGTYYVHLSATNYYDDYQYLRDNYPIEVIPVYNTIYDGNGNTSGIVPVDSTDYLEGDTVTVLGNPGGLVRTGRTFDGWNTQADGHGTNYNSGNTFSMPASDVTLYAMWGIHILYNGNGNTGGAVPTDSNVYYESDTVTVRANTGSLTKTNFTWNGWDTQPDGQGIRYAASDTFSIIENINLYAYWGVRITYNGNGYTGGAVPVDSVIHDVSDLITVLGNTGSLVKTGFVFNGWNTLASGLGIHFNTDDVFIGVQNTTLYAEWTDLIAEFHSDIRNGFVNTVVHFIDDSVGEHTVWDWNFGDGSPHSYVQNPSHTYTSPGSYTVTLTIFNGLLEYTEVKVGYINIYVNETGSGFVRDSGPTLIFD